MTFRRVFVHGAGRRGADAWPGIVRGVPTLVVTGGWNDEYELIAARLVEDGAQHAVLPGAQHRAQDAPGFAEAARGFERSLSR